MLVEKFIKLDHLDEYKIISEKQLKWKSFIVVIENDEKIGT